MLAIIVYLLRCSGAAIRVGEAARNHQIPSQGDLDILNLPARGFIR